MSIDDTHPEARANGNGHVPLGSSQSNGEAAPGPPDPRAAASIGAPAIQVAPGELAEATLSVTNLSTEPCRFALTLSGLEPGWYGLPAQVGPIAPGARAEVPFHVTLPRGYPPCTLLVSVEARPLPGDGPAGPARSDVQVLVGDGATVAARLEPVDVVGGRRGRFSVVLRNRGSLSQQVRLDGVAPDPGLAVRFEPDAPLLLPGHEVQVRGSVRARRPFFGEAQRRPFAVRVQGRGTPVMAEGSYTSRPWLPGWASKALVVGLVVALWAAVAVVGIRTLSSHLHRSALQHATLAPPHTPGHRPTSSSGAPGGARARASTPATPSGGSSSPSSSSPSSSPPSSSSPSSPSSSGSPSSSPAKPTVEVTGKVGGAAPGGVTVTLAPTTLVSPQVLGASGTPTATLASAVRRNHHRGAARRSSRIPDGKVYGTEAAAAFFPGLTAAVTPTLTTTTAPDGSFVFTGVTAPGTYLASFSEPGYNTRKYVVQTSPGANVTLDTALSPGTGSLSGLVRGPSGPLGGVSITVSDGSVTITTVTPTTGSGVGTWSVSGLNTPDSYLVSASAPGYGTQITTATLAPSASMAGVDLTLAPGVGSIGGTVTDATSGQPVGDVTVTASDGTASATATTSTVSPVGTYELPNLAIPGTWTLSISGQGWITQTQRVKLGGNTTVNASLTTSGANVVGVVSSAGSGLANVGLSLSNQHATFKTLSESVAPVGGFDFGQIPPGQYVLSATKFGYTTQSASVDVTAGQTKTVDLSLPFVGQSSVKTGTITGSVVNQSTGAALAGVPIDLDGKPTGTTTNANGAYTVTGVAPGLHEITALGATVTVGSTIGGFADAGVQVSVPQGATVTAPIIALPKLASISGTVLSAATGAPIPTPTVKLLQGTTVLGAPVKVTTASTGNYTITGIPAGTYVLQASAPGYEPSDTNVSVGAGENLTDDVFLTLGPIFQVETYLESPAGPLPEGGVCVTVALASDPTQSTTKLSVAGQPLSFPDLVSGDGYVASFKLPTTALSTPAGCATASFRAQAPTDAFVAQPDNTAIYPAVLSASSGALSVQLEFPFVQSVSGGSGVGKTMDCPVEVPKGLSTPSALCPTVAATATGLPTVDVTGTVGYATQSNGNPGAPQTATVPLVPPTTGSDVWTYPTGASAPKFVSPQVTLVVSDAGIGQFQLLDRPITLPTGTTPETFDELLTPVPVPVEGTIVPTSGVTVSVQPDKLAPSSTFPTANSLTSVDTISVIEGSGGALDWSDTATGAGGTAQPGTYTLTLSAKGYDSVGPVTVSVPLCHPKATGACTPVTVPTSDLTLAQQVTLVVAPTNVPGAPLTAPVVTVFYDGAKVATATLSGGTATFTDVLSPGQAAKASTANKSGYTYTVSGEGIQTYTSGTLTLGTAKGGILTEHPALSQDGWITGTLEGIIVPGATGPGAQEALSGATVTVTLASTSSCPAPATPTYTSPLTATTASDGAFVVVGKPGGLCPTGTYTLSAAATGFVSGPTPPVTVTISAGGGDTTVGTVAIDAAKITQEVIVSGVSAGVVVTVSATSPLGPTITCTLAAPTTNGKTTKTCSPTASAVGTTSRTGSTVTFSFRLDPTTYSFTLSAPQYETTTLGPEPYQPGIQPSPISYTLVAQTATVTGTVTVSATGASAGAVAIATLPLSLVVSGSKKVQATTTTGVSGDYSFSNVPSGSYTIEPGDTYLTPSPLDVSVGSVAQVTENFTVYAAAQQVTVTVTDPKAATTGTSANGVTVTLTPPASDSTTSRTCGSGTSPLLEALAGTPQTATAVGTTPTTATATFTSVVPDTFTVHVTGVGTAGDAPPQPSTPFVLCPGGATSPSSVSVALAVAKVSVTVTLTPVPTASTTVSVAATPTTPSGGAPLDGSCTAPAAAAGCTATVLVALHTTYALSISAAGYGSASVSLAAFTTNGATSKSVTLKRADVTIDLSTTTSNAAVTAALAGATVTLTSTSKTYTETANADGVASFPTVTVGSYTISVTPDLPHASQQSPLGTVVVTTTAGSVVPVSLTVTIATGTVTGTVTLGGAAPSAQVVVTISVLTSSGAAVTCGQVAVPAGTSSATYTCTLPSGSSYKVSFAATGYSTATVTTTTGKSTVDVTLALP